MQCYCVMGHAVHINYKKRPLSLSIYVYAEWCNGVYAECCNGVYAEWCKPRHTTITIYYSEADRL